MTEGFRDVDVTRVASGRRTQASDRAATEEPMEVRINGESFAVIMRTPGRDHDLAAGFLLAEQLIRTVDDIGVIRHCTDPETPELLNVVNVSLVSDRAAGRLTQRRHVVMSSSCGLCGRVTLDSLQADAPAIDAAWTMTVDRVAGLPVRLREGQRAFDETGGVHAAGLFDADGSLELLAEDVGRHNAVDKVVGRMVLQDRLPASSRALFVSGRASFEIVQKALLAGVPIVGAVSAPTSLAVELAAESGITLLGFVRGASFNVYTHPHRIV